MNKTDINEAVRIAYQQGRKDALEEVKREIENASQYEPHGLIGVETVTEIIDKAEGEEG